MRHSNVCEDSDSDLQIFGHRGERSHGVNSVVVFKADIASVRVSRRTQIDHDTTKFQITIRNLKTQFYASLRTTAAE